MGIEVIYTLDQFESEWWSGIVKRFRAKYIKTPKEYVNLFVTSGKIKKRKN